VCEQATEAAMEKKSVGRGSHAAATEGRGVAGGDTIVSYREISGIR
jgi:hypothetical protein